MVPYCREFQGVCYIAYCGERIYLCTVWTIFVLKVIRVQPCFYLSILPSYGTDIICLFIYDASFMLVKHFMPKSRFFFSRSKLYYLPRVIFHTVKDFTIFSCYLFIYLLLIDLLGQSISQF